MWFSVKKVDIQKTVFRILWKKKYLEYYPSLIILRWYYSGVKLKNNIEVLINKYLKEKLSIYFQS